MGQLDTCKVFVGQFLLRPKKMAKQGSISRAVKLVAMMWELYGIITILQYENGVRILKT